MASASDDRTKAIVAALQQQSDPLTRRIGRDEWLSATDLAARIGDTRDRSTVFRMLNELVTEGLLEASGETRSRRYRLARDSLPFLEWELSQPRDTRPPVQYRRELLDAYKPNRTRWLAPERSARLLEVGRADFEVEAATYRQITNTFLIDLSYASSKLEDVNISWLDTKKLIELGERPRGLTDQELRIVSNHKEAIQYLAEDRKNLQIARRPIFDVHSLLSEGLLGDPEDRGCLRRRAVSFAESAYRPIDNGFVLGEEFDKFCRKASDIRDPFEQAIFVMTFMAYLQPFIDVNKRTSRLCMNMPLLKHRLAPYSFVHTNRQDYIFGLLAFYERGRHEWIVDAFESGYLQSGPKYVEAMKFVHEGGALSSLSPPPLGRRGQPP